MDILQATFHWLLQPQHWTGDAGILLRLREHLYYVLISIVVASAIALPLGIILGYWRKGAFVIINLFNIGRAIPSLGLILLCIIVFGFNDIPVFTALVAMSIPPILTNAWVGIYHADRQLCDAAKALGMTPLQSLWQLRIPLAAPLILAGLRRAWRPRALSDRRTWPARYSPGHCRFAGGIAAGHRLRAAFFITLPAHRSGAGHANKLISQQQKTTCR